eukprot:gene23639-biopygen23844
MRSGVSRGSPGTLYPPLCGQESISLYPDGIPKLSPEVHGRSDPGARPVRSRCTAGPIQVHGLSDPGARPVRARSRAGAWLVGRPESQPTVRSSRPMSAGRKDSAQGKTAADAGRTRAARSDQLKNGRGADADRTQAEPFLPTDRACIPLRPLPLLGNTHEPNAPCVPPLITSCGVMRGA